MRWTSARSLRIYRRLDKKHSPSHNASTTIAVQITVAEKKQLEARARARTRPISGYVAQVSVEDLGRGEGDAEKL